MQTIINKFLDDTIAQFKLPGIAIGVYRGASENYDSCRCIGVDGYRNYVNRESLHEDDIFHCASVSKLFTSSAIMILVEAGILNLYDRLCDILPCFHIADKRFMEIRLWNMLTHTSGLGDVTDYHWDTPEKDDLALARYVYESSEVQDTPMLWSPQTIPGFYDCPERDKSGFTLNLFRYSNIAYEILGQIVSEYSLKFCGSFLSYEDFIARFLFEPAGMKSSTMKTFQREGENMAVPHEKQTGTSTIRKVKHYPYTRQHAPSSTLTSNINDLLHWGQANLLSARGKDERILHKETYDSIWREYANVTNNDEKMGLGWFVRKQSGYTLYGHEGTDTGFRASFWLCPELDMVTVVLSNLSGAPVKKINKKLFDIVIG